MEHGTETWKAFLADGRKLVRLEACSPDVTALMPLIARASGRLCIKNSPLFDVDEALRLFPDSRVEVVSLGDECKEVLVYADGTGPTLTATALGRGSFTATPGQTPPPVPPAAAPVAGLAAVFATGGSRVSRRDGRA